MENTAAIGMAEKETLEMKNEKETTEIMEMNNTPRALIAGCACVVTSLLTCEQLEHFKMFRPESLTLYDEVDHHKLYSLDIGESSGCILEDHAEYSKVPSREGKATITILFDPEIGDRRGAFEERIWPGLRLMERLERKLIRELPALDEEHERAARMVAFM